MRCLTRAVLLLFVILFLQITVNAEITNTKDHIASARIHRLLELMPESGLGFPNDLKSDRDVWVLMTSGAATFETIILMRKSVNPFQLAAWFDMMNIRMPFAGRRIKISEEDDYNTLSVVYSKERLFQKESTFTIPAGKIINGLKSIGYAPHVLLRIPKWVTCDSLSVASYSTKNFLWYNESAASESLVVAVTYKLPDKFILYAAFYILIIPFVMLISLIAAFTIVKNESIPIGKRRFLFGKVMLGPTIVSLMLYLPLSFYILQLGYISRVVDLWFGSVTTAVLLQILISLPFFGLLAMFMLRLFMEKKLFGSRVQNDDTKIELSPEEKAINKKIAVLSLIFTAVGFAGIFLRDYLPPNSQMKVIFNFFTAMMVPMSGPLSKWIFKKRLEKAHKTSLEMIGINPIQLDTDKANITNRAEYIARNLGVKLKDVTIDESTEGRSFAQAMAMPGNKVNISRKTIDVLSPDELDFILTHEVAHMKAGHLKTSLLFLIIPILTVISFFIWRSQMAHNQNSGFSFPWMMMLIPLTPVFFLPIQLFLSKRREYYADYLALKETRNLEAAQSALIKMMKNSPIPYIHEYEDISTHPKMAKRLAALKRIAEQIGLPTADLHRPSLESEG